VGDATKSNHPDMPANHYATLYTNANAMRYEAFLYTNFFRLFLVKQLTPIS
jgi:hypothetical protein